MNFMRTINKELAEAKLVQVSSGLHVPHIPDSCGEAVKNTGMNYEMKIMTYQYLLAAVEYLEIKIET